MGEMMILGRVLEPSKPADGLLGAWRFGSCIADEIVLLHHSDGTFRLTATVRTDHSETSHSVLSAPSPKVAESRWLVRAREYAPSLYEIMAAETARTVTLFGRDARADIEGIETRVGLNIAEAWGSDVDGWAVRVIARDADLTETQRVTARGPTLAEAEQAWLAHASLHAPTLCAEVAPC